MTAKKRHAGETAKHNGKSDTAIINELEYQWEKFKGNSREAQKKVAALMNKVAALMNKAETLWGEYKSRFCELQKCVHDRDRVKFRTLSELVEETDRRFAEARALAAKMEWVIENV